MRTPERRNNRKAGRLATASRERSIFAHLLLGLLMCLTMVGCASDRSAVLTEAQSQQEYGREGIAELLEDGAISRSDFQSSFDEMRQCYEARGYQVEGPLINPVDGLRLLYKVSGSGIVNSSIQVGGTEQEDAMECGEPHEQLAATYTGTQQQVMDEVVRARAFECIESRKGDVYQDAVNFEEMVGDPDSDSGTQRRLVGQCVLESVAELHPGLPLTAGY